MRALLCAIALWGCSSPERALEPLAVEPGCNPIAVTPGRPGDCLLPYPSDFFRGADGRVAIAPAAQLHDKSGAPIDLLARRPPAGFSPGSQILALFPGGVDDANLAGASADATVTLGEGSPTVLLDESGQRVLHLAELDPRALDDDRRALVIRPLVRLKDAVRYVVAIRRLRAKDGSAVPAPEGFRRLRDGEAGGDPALRPLVARYEAGVFAPLAKAGIDRAELQLAWDFTVRPRADATADMLAVRDGTLAYYGTHPAKLTLVSVVDAPDAYTARRLELTLEVPLFLEASGPLAALHRDASGSPAPNGTVEVPLSVWLPKSVAARPPNGPPARLVQFGHGFFGSRAEVGDYFSQIADERGFVVVAADWWGMSAADKDPVASTLVSDMAKALGFGDRVHQSMANFLAVSLAVDALALLPELTPGPKPPFDAGATYYYGNSMGHILGGLYVALSPRIARAALLVGGVDWSFIMFRSRPFLGFLTFVALVLPDWLDQQKFAVLAQGELDRIDPLVYLPWLLQPLGGTPKARRLLMQIGIGDASVPNLAAHLQARSLGIGLLQPSPRQVAGIAPVKAPLDGSALVEIDYGIHPLPDAKAVASVDDTPVHEAVRRSKPAQEQIDRFFRPGGKIEATCSGPCDPD